MLETLKRLFGKGQTAQDRARSSLLDGWGPDNMPDGCLAALWELHWNRMPETPRLIQEARQAMTGGMTWAMAPEWDVQDRETFRPGGPDAWERPRKVAKRLASKKSRIKRPNTTLGPDAQRDSTRIEQWDNAFTDTYFPDFAVTEMSLNEGWTLTITQPEPTMLKQRPTLYDEFEEDGKYTNQDEYDALPESRKREYARANTDDDEPTYKRVKKKYRRNLKGEKDDGSDTFEMDPLKTRRAFRDELKDIAARNCPIRFRGPISRLDFVPIDPVFSGKRTEVEGVIVRTLYRKSKLRRLFAWDGCEELIEPAGPDGKDGEWYLYELWAYDEYRRPYVAYQVGSKTTYHANDSSTAIIKLWEEYPGMTELPISVEPGDHIAISDPDKVSLPYPIPFIDNWRQRNSIVNSLAISVAGSAYPTWGQEITPEALDVLERLGGDIDLEFRMRPNVVQPLFGKVTELTARGSNADLKTLYAMLQELNDREMDSPASFGGEGASSGLERQVIGKDMEVSHSCVIEAVRRHKEATGRHALMIGSALGRKMDRPVELYEIGTAPNPKTGGTVTKRTLVTLPPDLCDDNWDVVAQFETQPGEHLAQSSLFLEALNQGAILLEEYREWAIGDENPEIFMWKKVLEDYFLKSPAGQLDALTAMAEYLADDRVKQNLELQAQGRITAQEGGAATAAMADLMGGASAPNTGMAPGWNSGQAALAGGNGAALRADAASMGSPLDGGAPMVA